MNTQKITMEKVGDEVVCKYWEHETTSWIICEMTQAEVERIMTTDYKVIWKYLHKLYNEKLKEQEKPYFKLVWCSEEISTIIDNLE